MFTVRLRQDGLSCQLQSNSNGVNRFVESAVNMFGYLGV